MPEAKKILTQLAQEIEVFVNEMTLLNKSLALPFMIDEYICIVQFD